MSDQTLEAFKLYQNIHIIGIGGIGISAIARILAKQGHKVTGSDQNESHNTNLLSHEGITVIIGQKAENIPESTDLVIFTTAIPKSNPEFQEAENRKLKMLSYPQTIGLITKYFRTISICGTHGKTTTTALLGLMLEACQADPTVIVGSLLKEYGDKNERLGQSNWLVLESCEYQEAFLNYQPEIVVLTSIEPEHLDYFQTAANYLQAFRKFLQKIPSNGLLVANSDDLNIQTLISEQNWPFPIYTYGKNSGIFRYNSTHITLPEKENLPLKLAIPGDHNLANTTAAIAVISWLNLDQKIAMESISTFRGAARRFEIKGHLGKATLVDDYGHTPTEIKATLQGAKQFFGQNSNILVIFQPHQYSRTHHFLKDFGLAFTEATTVLVPNIYRSRDTDEDLASVNVDQLIEQINLNSITQKALNTHNFQETLNYVKEHAAEYDAILTIGAGDITNISEQIAALS